MRRGALLIASGVLVSVQRGRTKYSLTAYHIDLDGRPVSATTAEGFRITQAHRSGGCDRLMPAGVTPEKLFRSLSTVGGVSCIWQRLRRLEHVE